MDNMALIESFIYYHAIPSSSGKEGCLKHYIKTNLKFSSVNYENVFFYSFMTAKGTKKENPP
jgi:hypothetical protein